MNRKFMSAISFFIFIAIIAFTVFSMLHIGSHCPDIGCDLCAQIQSVKKVVESLLLNVAVSALIIFSLYSVKLFASKCSDAEKNETLVEYRVKLSN